MMTNDRARELARAILDGNARTADMRELALCVLSASTERHPHGSVIRYYRDCGDVWRLVDESGRRYYWETGAAFWAEERYSRDAAMWDKHTAFTEREAQLLWDALSREQRTAAALDRIAGRIAAFGEAITEAKAWQSRRRDG